MNPQVKNHARSFEALQAAQAPPGVVGDPGRLLDYLVERMLTGYEQDDDVTVLVVHKTSL